MAVLLVVTNTSNIGDTDQKTGWYLPEVAHPYKVFKDAGVSVTIVSPRGGKAPLDQTSVEAFKEDPICKNFLADKTWLELFEKTPSLADVDIKDFKVIFFAGGHGPMFDLPKCESTNKAAAEIYEKGGVVAAVCHGVAGLVNAKLSNGEWLVKGQKLTCFTNEEEDMVQMSSLMPFMLETALTDHGAQFVGAAPFTSNVQGSGRVLTGQNPASSTPLAELVVKTLKKL